VKQSKITSYADFLKEQGQNRHQPVASAEHEVNPSLGLRKAEMSDSNVLGHARYDAMVLAIEACHRVDEVKEIRDKARAIEVYAAQALNRNAERKAAEVRIRAERKTGELLKETKQSGERRGDGGSGANQHSKEVKEEPSVSKRVPKLKDLGISYDQSSKWQKLAEIPKEKFDEALANPHVIPSTEGVLEAVAPPFHMDPIKYDKDALMAHGHIMDFREIMQRPAEELFDLMRDFQREEVVALIPEVIAWLQRISKAPLSAEQGQTQETR
jgi:hypothetical protein